MATKTSLKRAMFRSSDSDTESVSGKKDTPATVGGPDPDSAEVHRLPPAEIYSGPVTRRLNGIYSQDNNYAKYSSTFNLISC